MPEVMPTPKPKAVFRVTFRDGATVITSASSSLQAEQKASRQRSGIIKETKFVRNGK